MVFCVDACEWVMDESMNGVVVVRVDVGVCLIGCCVACGQWVRCGVNECRMPKVSDKTGCCDACDQFV